MVCQDDCCYDCSMHTPSNTESTVAGAGVISLTSFDLFEVDSPDDVVSWLEAGGDPSMVDSEGCSPLHILCYYGHVEAARVLLQHAKENIDVDKYDNNGQTPLMAAAIKGRAECVQVLLESGASTDAVDNEGQTARDWASVLGHSDVLAVFDGANKLSAGI